MDRKLWYILGGLLLFSLAVIPAVAAGERDAGAVVLVNSQAAARSEFDRYLKLYLDYFDVPYRILDTAGGELPGGWEQAAVVIAGHDGSLGSLTSRDRERIAGYVRAGGGLFLFDTALFAASGRHLGEELLSLRPGEPVTVDEAVVIEPGDVTHFITAYKADRTVLKTVPARRVKLKVPGVSAFGDQAKVLMKIGGKPLVISGAYGQGRIVQWTTYGWLDPNVLGFFNGLDDIVWRSLVWVARKPFVFQGNIPQVGMRIDDCVGLDMDFVYIDTINKHGIIPHIAFMMDDTPSSAADKLGEYTQAGKAEAFIHARQRAGFTGFFFWDFDFNDFNRGKPFGDDVLRRNFEELEAFHRMHNIQYAKTATPHYVPAATNTLPYLRAMGVAFDAVSPVSLPNSSEYHFWPYELYQRAGYFDISFSSYGDGNFVYRSGMTMDWVEKDPSLFCTTSHVLSIKADWLRPSRAPGFEESRKVEGMIIDGTDMLRLALDSMGPAFFFTHELNIGLLEGGAGQLDRAFEGVMRNLRKFHNVIPCGFDQLNQYGKNIRTGDLSAARYDPTTRSLYVDWRGFTDMPTKFHVFTEEAGEIKDALVDLPVYRGPVSVKVRLDVE
ncbi:MAG: hypothetical protein EHM61_16015 [Acidobacteria bacterium]|nr:MAG: hypothetical protein EHM61_16015 [Acidobacteriota bacterium]